MSAGLAAAWRQRWGRCREILRGIKNNFRYSNGLQLNFQRLFRRGAAEVVYVWDKRIRIACDCARGEHFGVHEVFTERCYAPHLDRCRFDGSRIRYVDVGANVGAFGLGLVARGLAIELGIAAELNPVTAARCRRNVERNGLAGVVRVVNGGVAGSDGWLDFAPTAHALGDNLFHSAPGGAGQRVELLSLPTLLQRHAGGCTDFDLLKLDCEGAEYAILRTAPADVLRAFRYLLIEFHAAPVGESLAAAEARLGGCGFVRDGKGAAALPFVALWVRSG